MFELSKVERPDIRARMLSHLQNIHPQLLAAVEKGLGMRSTGAAKAARPTREDLPASDALSILKRPPGRFEGRKLGVLLTDGADAELFRALETAIVKAGGSVEVVAPKIAGATLSDGVLVSAKQKIDGGPSVLYDAVAVIASDAGAALLAKDAAAKDFVTDAFAHCKFIGYSPQVAVLLEKAGLSGDLDEACVVLAKPADARPFAQACAKLRHWPRELAVDLDA